MPARRKITIAAGVIQNGRRELLIARRFDSLPFGGLWEFPAGRVRAGESPEAALRRVAVAKLGIQIEIDVGQPPFVHERDKQILTFRYFFAHVAAGQARPIRYAEVRWVATGQLCEYDFEPAAKQVADWLARDI